MLDKLAASDSRSHDELVRDSAPGEGGSLLVVRRPYERVVSAYMDKIARDNKTGLWSVVKQISGQTNSDSAPTFQEFVNYLIWQDDNGIIMDGHWAPQEELSRVCVCDFQYIVRQEAMDEEMPYVMRMLGLEQEARHPIGQRNARRQPYDAMEILAQLNKKQRDRMDSIYEMDIILFQ